MKMETKGAGEVRRVHIVYFLSRKGRIEHPHLIRVNPLNLNGVHLRDVKRWLSDLRGKEMPDAFAWSYKRRYKAGYVWQDLLDDDLITPVSDNEYVLKGSEISPTFSDKCSCWEIKNERAEKKSALEVFTEASESPQITKGNSKSAEEIKLVDDPEKTPPRIDGEFRTSGEVSCSETEDSTFRRTSSTIRFEGDGACKEEVEISREVETSRDCSSDTKNGKLRGWNAASKGVQVFRDLLHCGVVDTNDVAVTSIKRNINLDNKKYENIGGEICRREVMGGSERIGAGNWSQYHEKSRSNSWNSGNQKTVSAVYKLVGKPNCSQCGKGFKPEKLHAHMRSCQGLRARLKIVEAQRKVAERATMDMFS